MCSSDLFALRQQVSEGPTIGLVGLGDEYFVAARLIGREVRLFLSNAAVAADDRIAGDLVERLDPAADPQDSAEVPFGDQEIFADKLYQYDQLSKLDKWKTTLLLRVKGAIEKDEEDFS